eukprot:5812190-Alexandrium_andersonii.AAC.1
MITLQSSRARALKAHPEASSSSAESPLPCLTKAGVGYVVTPWGAAWRPRSPVSLEKCFRGET